MADGHLRGGAEWRRDFDLELGEGGGAARVAPNAKAAAARVDCMSRGVPAAAYIGADTGPRRVAPGARGGVHRQYSVSSPSLT